MAFDGSGVSREDRTVATKKPNAYTAAEARAIKLLEEEQQSEQRSDRRRVVANPVRATRIGGQQTAAQEAKLEGEMERSSTDAAHPAHRPRRSDSPDFDGELGRIPEWGGPTEAPPPADAQARWVRIATDLVPLLGELSGYRKVMPIARPPAGELRAAQANVSAELLRVLPELEALHRKLLPGWRAIVEQWFLSAALAKIEDAQRALRKPVENVKGVGHTLTNTVPARHVVTAAQLLAQLRRNPPELMGEIPAGLTENMLAGAAEKVARKAGGKGLTPAKATEFVELLALDANKAQSLAERRTAAVKSRTKRREKALNKRAKRRKN